MAEYDVFISYRRKDGSAMAQLLKEKLTACGHQVFLDYHGLNPGDFDTQLEDTIRETPNFIVILSPEALPSSHEPDSWLRQEIETALDSGRNIIPVFMPYFSWSPLPDSIQPLRRKQGVSFIFEYADAAVDRICGYLKTAAEIKPEAPAPQAPPPICQDSIVHTAAASDCKENDRAWLAEMIEKGDAVLTNNGGFKVYPDYYKHLPRSKRHVESMAEGKAVRVMAALSAAGIRFSAASIGENRVGITVSTENELSYKQIEKAVEEEHAAEYVHPAFYRTLPKQERFIRFMNEMQARKKSAELAAMGIEYSAVFKGSKSAVTVARKDAHQAFFSSGSQEQEHPSEKNHHQGSESS